MIGYHVTTFRKLKRYEGTGCILPPIRFWPNLYTAKKWKEKTKRTLIIKIEANISYPLPDHKPARWTLEHIKINHYHYSNKAITYGACNWRCERMNRLREILMNGISFNNET
jgi:hypothetical protein